MPEKIGVRELKNQASKIVRSVREEMAEYIVTVRGEPVAILRPLTRAESENLRQVRVEDTLARMKALAEKIGETWESEKSGTEILEDMREERWQSLTQAL